MSKTTEVLIQLALAADFVVAFLWIVRFAIRLREGKEP